ncbi:centrosomal protein of 135 kDa isoform X1 [Dendroctonus ponderosae]|uniref:centrosomal protein of 135 kDa isoform X1 n=2 Tax=Dendroctonus ponderosae TaxID=77166 RepID=UPI002034EDEB|nr:centrosomal protein of 135 kDa isoform X1 [Dendroctonus ponderosae]
MGSKFLKLRQQLDELGYLQDLVPECIPLVEKLLLDLNTTTTSLQKYMKISQHALEERDFLELGAEPYKCDNAKLIRECNDLHQAFIHFKEQHEKIQRDLRRQASNLQTQLDNCSLEKNKLIGQIQTLEKEKYRKGSKLNAAKDALCKSKPNVNIDSAMASAKNTNAELKRQLKDLEDKHLQLTEDNTVLKNQVKTRDEQIERLQSLMEGGRSYNSASKNCCYKNIDRQIVILQDEVTRLKKEKSELEMQIKEAIAKQHEAMKRALHLAERNRQLEKELKDVDEIALAVEAECNNTVKGNSEKVARLQDRINESLVLIQNLERDNTKLKHAKLELSADLDSVKLEKNHLQAQLKKEEDDKKKLTDKINSFTIIENDLNLEIDRLSKLSSEYKRRIAELEAQHTHKFGEKLDSVKEDVTRSTQEVQSNVEQLIMKSKKTHKKSCKKSNKSPTKNRSPTRTEPVKSSIDNAESNKKCCCESGNCIKNLRDLLDKEVEYREVHAKQSMEDLRQEKEFYMKEYHRALEQLRNVPNYEISENGIAQLKQQLKDKENQIKQLEDEIQKMNWEKSQTLKGELPGQTYSKVPCTKSTCRIRERELEIKSQDLKYIEMENNNLKAKLQSINESALFNEERMKKAFKDMEEHIRKLEDERRDLVKTELTHRSNMSHLEDDYRSALDQLQKTQQELNAQRANYAQLKLLHEQTDRSLSEVQVQLIRAQSELANYQSKVKDSSRDSLAYDKEIARLKSDIQIMQANLTKIDREKDDLMNNLDTKTEKVALLEDNLASKSKMISKLEDELKELNRRLSKHLTESSSQDQIVRSKQKDLEILEQDYEKERQLREAAILENKRLQNDLSSVSYDCREARNELDLYKRQVEDLKRQLQHYVAEVKRTEDLISQKELERSELLDQFRSLSQEANILESNNHTLETEANQSKIQLSVALDHTSELERNMQHQESIMKSYEKQISELTSQVARLEVQLKQILIEKEHCNVELKQMGDLCVKLDKDKDDLKSELSNREDRRSNIQMLSEKLSSEKVTLQKALEQERSSLEAVEKLLNDSRRDLTEHRLLNQDLQREVNRLKQKVEELEERLSKFGRKGQFSSLLSTKTLTQPPGKFHGSDGILQGAINLTHINNQEENMHIEPSEIKKDHIFRANSSKALSEDYHLSTCSIQSTKTLVAVSEKKQASVNLRNSVIDLTKLDQNNIDCFEQCDRVQCPLHQKLFFNANQLNKEPKTCKHCKNACNASEGTNIDVERNHQAEDGEISSDNVSKCVDFAIEVSDKQPDRILNKKVTPGKDNALNAKADKTVKNRELSERSVTSTKTLIVEKKDELRNSTKGVMDLHRIDYSPGADTAKNEKIVRNLDAIRRGAIAKQLASNDQHLPKNDTVSECLKHYKTKLGGRPLTPINTSNGSNLCFENKCSDYILRKNTRQLEQAHDRWKSSKKIEDEVEHQRNRKIVERSPSCEKKRFGSSSESSVVTSLEAANLKSNEVITEVFRYTDKSHKDEKIAEPTDSNVHKMYPELSQLNSERSKINSPNNKNCAENLPHKYRVSDSPATQKNNEVYATFDKPEDSSAVFRKVFLVDGVGLECQCCISSYKIAKH